MRSCHAIYAQTFIVATRSSETKRLVQVVSFQKWILFQNFGPVWIRGQQFEYAPNSNPHSAYAGLTTALSDLDGDSVERSNYRHRIAIKPEWQQAQLSAWVFGMFAALAMVLAAVGLFSVVV